MTRRRPIAQYPEIRRQLPDLKSPPAQVPPGIPTSEGDVIEPFQVGGGQTYYLSGWIAPDSTWPYAPPQFGATQLVALQYVPKGRTAYIKRVMIAPCAPPALVDPWRGWDGTANLFQPRGAPYDSVQRAPAQAGLWETPLAWEGYVSPSEGPVRHPKWTWIVTILNGPIEKNRPQTQPPFDVTDPASWYLVPDVAVPNWVYRSGVPGRFIPGYIGPQRIQQPPSNPLPLHALVPEDSTICLWAQWTQDPIRPEGVSQNGPIELFPGGIIPAPPPTTYPENVIVALLPAVGSLTGYMQAAGRDAAKTNARYGWGA